MADTIDFGGGYDEEERLAAMRRALGQTSPKVKGGMVDPVSGAYVPNYNDPESPLPPHVGKYGPYDPSNSGFTQPQQTVKIGDTEYVSGGAGGSFTPTTGPNLSPDQLAYIQAEIARTSEVNRPKAPAVPAPTGSLATPPANAQPVNLTPQQPTSAPRPPVVQQPFAPIASVPQQPKGPVNLGPLGIQTPGAVAGPPQSPANIHPPTPATPAPAIGAAPIGNQGGQAPVGQTGSGSPMLDNLTSTILQQIQGISSQIANPQSSPDVSAVFMRHANSILGMLNEQEVQLRSEYEKSGQQVDPSTQFAITKMRENLEENLKTAREEMNRRGLYESGIALEVENRLQKGSASDEAMLLANRLSKLQDDLSKGLTSIRQQKVSTLGQFGLAGAQAQFTSDENTRRIGVDRERSLIDSLMGLRGQASGEFQTERRITTDDARARMQIDAQSNLAAAQRAFDAAQNAVNRNATAANQQAAQQAARQLEQMRQAAENDRLQTEIGSGKYAREPKDNSITPYQQALLEMERQKFGYQQQQDATKNAGNFSVAATDRAIAEAQKFQSRSDLEAWFQQKGYLMQQDGVNLKTLREWIDRNHPIPSD